MTMNHGQQTWNVDTFVLAINDLVGENADRSSLRSLALDSHGQLERRGERIGSSRIYGT